MRRFVAVLVLVAAVLFTGAIGSTASGVADETGPYSVPPAPAAPAPLPPAPAVSSGSLNTALVHWDKFYDRNGNPLPDGPQDNVGMDSLYFRRYDVQDTFYGCPKSQVPNPAPASCRPPFAFQIDQSMLCMDPAGVYGYEVYSNTLRRHNTADGSHVDYPIEHGDQNCGTDGIYVYVPVGNVVYKYTLDGTLVSSTTLDITPAWFEFSVANDTVWCAADVSTLHGYACAKFTGGSISTDATWDVGSGSLHAGKVAWDGQYYYVIWLGSTSNTFKRFNANRTVSATGTASIDPRGLMCAVRGTRVVTQDSLYWKLYSSTTELYSSPKGQDVTAAQPSPLAWQGNQTISCMTPDGRYLFEVSGSNMRRTDLLTGGVANFTMADASGGACATDGQYIYVPNSTTTRKYTLDGTLVSSTTTDYAPWVGSSTFGFGVANDTVWITPASEGTTWYGYACSKFSGGSINHDATWTTAGGSASAMNVNYDGQYYYMAFGGYDANTLLRFYGDRTLYSTGTVNGDVRGIMSRRGGYAVMVCHGESQSYATSLRRMLLDSCGSKFAAVDTWHIGSGGHAAFPATDCYKQGYRAILALTNESPVDSEALGDSLARFVELGGGVVEAVFADYGPQYKITGDWRYDYAPFTVQTNSYTRDSLGTVHQPLHPIMAGVSALRMNDYVTGNTHGTLRSPRSVCLAEFTTANRCVAAVFDSAGQRAVSLGIYPLTYWKDGASGQWCRLMLNALDWAAVGPSVGVSVPNGGEDWPGGTVHTISWTQTPNCVSDSIYYSTDGGSSWTGVVYFATPPAPLEYSWTVPATPTDQGLVKIVTWNSAGGRVEDVSNDVFTISATGVEQPRNGNLPTVFALYQPYPNPLARSAEIRYDLPRPAPVELKVYDATGMLVRRLVGETQAAGRLRAHWNGNDNLGRTVAPGVYYCRLTAGSFQATQKLIVRR